MRIKGQTNWGSDDCLHLHPRLLRRTINYRPHPVIASRSEAIQACCDASILKKGHEFARAMILLDCFASTRNDGERATTGLLPVTPEDGDESALGNKASLSGR